jgi:DNA-binding NarL/FixJ family response regulator
MAIRTAIQQRQRLLREGLELLLDPVPDLEWIGSVEIGEQLFDLCARDLPNVVLLEIDVREWDPRRLAYRLQQRWRTVQFVGVCRREGEEAELARRSGMHRLVSYETDSATLVQTVKAAAVEVAPVRRPATDTLPARALTVREIEILNLIAAGCTAREVSDRMEITYKTVENHKQRIFGKLGVQNQAHAVSIAFRRGILEPEKVLALADIR